MKIIDKHDFISRLVKPEDVDRVYYEAEEIYKLLNKKLGMYPGFYAIAQPQCVKEDPLRFFVVNPKVDIFSKWISVVIINPVILRHTSNTVDSEEGCATFSTMPTKKMQRWNKCEVEYTPLEFDKNKKPLLGARQVINCSGKLSKVIQHEIDHLNAKYIY